MDWLGVVIFGKKKNIGGEDWKSEFIAINLILSFGFEFKRGRKGEGRERCDFY